MKHINRRLESLLCSFNPSPSGELEGGLYISDIGSGFTTALQRNHNGVAVCLPAHSLRERAGGEAVVLLISKCKITTIFADVPTNYGKIHVRFEENALCARNLLIHSEKFSEGILQTDKLS